MNESFARSLFSAARPNFTTFKRAIFSHLWNIERNTKHKTLPISEKAKTFFVNSLYHPLVIFYQPSGHLLIKWKLKFKKQMQSWILSLSSPLRLPCDRFLPQVRPFLHQIRPFFERKKYFKQMRSWPLCSDDPREMLSLEDDLQTIFYCWSILIKYPMDSIFRSHIKFIKSTCWYANCVKNLGGL